MSTSPARSPAAASPRRCIFAPLHRRAVASPRRRIAAPSHRRVVASPQRCIAASWHRRIIPLWPLHRCAVSCLCAFACESALASTVPSAWRAPSRRINGSSRQAVVAVLFEQVVPKRSAHESVGVLANRDGQVREYSRTPHTHIPNQIQRLPFCAWSFACASVRRFARWCLVSSLSYSDARPLLHGRVRSQALRQ